MAFCRSCGKDMGDSRACPHCGASESVSGSGTAAAAADSPTSGIAQNVAGLLCYLFGWLSGLIFLLIDKRPFVRFHGAQSIALTLACFAIWIGYWILTLVLGIITAMFDFPVGFLLALLFPLLMLGFFATFIWCMYKAYQNEKYKLPVIGDMVEKMVG